jgi:putative transcriptional regulator
MKSEMVYIKLDKMLKREGRSLYWLSANAGVPYPTLWKLTNKEFQRSINLHVLSKICSALDCLPGDILVYEAGEEDSAIKNLVKSRDKEEKAKEEKKQKRK